MNKDNIHIVDKSKKNNKSVLRDIVVLQAIIIIYSCSTVIAKFASAEEFMSMHFIMLYGLELVFLGTYAIFWQQIIKKFEISIAYANRSIGLLWSLLFAIILFHERITVNNIIGVVIVMIGTIIVNRDGE